MKHRISMNMNCRWLLVALCACILLNACDAEEEMSGIEAGNLGVCVRTDSTADMFSEKGDILTFEGTVTEISQTNALCTASNVAIVIEDTDGVSWTLGLNIKTASGETVTPKLDLAIGDTVQVRGGMSGSWAICYRFAILDETGLVAAWADGGCALNASQMDGLSVTWETTAKSKDMEQCGTQESVTITMSGEENLSLESNKSGTLNMGDYALTVMNIGAWAYGDDYHCEDATGIIHWLAYREAASGR